MADNPILAAQERRSMGGGAESQLPIDFSKLLFLVVDAVPEMRSAMSMTLSSFGANRVEFAGRIAEAVGRVQRAQYDVILSDYTLNHDYDGMHLYEEVKQRNLIKQSCVFIVVTAERRSQMVMSAVELAPDDYLLKPFSGGLLAERLTKAIRKKQEFECVDSAMMNHEYLRAIEECNRRIKSNDPYILDFMKLKGRLSIMTGDYATAKDTYERVLSVKGIPWAKMGLAKALFQMKDYEPAEALFSEVLGYNDRVMEAYDWLAKVHALRGRNLEAQETLQKAVRISPWIVSRQKKLGEVAHRNQELGVAEDAFKQTISISKYSFWRDASNYANLAKVQIDRGDTKAALQTVGEVRKEFQNEPQAQMLSYAVESMALDKAGERDKALAALAEAQRRFDGIEGVVPSEYTLDLAQACFVAGDQDKATELVRQVVKNNHEDPEVLGRVSDLYTAMDREEEGRNLVQQTADDIVDINNRAVRMAREGDIEGSISLFLQAAEEMQGNTQILLNTINALLAYVNTKGWHESYMQAADRYLEQVRSMDRASAKFQKLDQLMKVTRQRFGGG